MKSRMNTCARILAATALILIPCCAQEYIISTVAGLAGPNVGMGDGGPALNSSLRAPSGVAVDSAGNVYIADTLHWAIRKIGLDGIISTVVGGPLSFGGGFSGDGGPASAAKTAGPTGVAVDGSGNIYFTDGHHIRKISPDGIINTVAGGGQCTAQGYGDGGPASKAYFYNAQSVSVDSRGNLYIPDSSNNQVRKVSPDGIISTVAGIATCRPAEAAGFSGDGGPATKAQIHGPMGTAIDAEGSLYIAEFGNSRVRRVDPAGNIMTIAGNGEPGSVGFRRTVPGGISDAMTVGIRPQGVVADAYGNVFIADPGNSRLWMLTQDGRMHVIAGNNQSNDLRDGIPAVKAALNPVGIALGKRGIIYIADAFYHRVRLLTPTHPPAEISSGADRQLGSAGGLKTAIAGTAGSTTGVSTAAGSTAGGTTAGGVNEPFRIMRPSAEDRNVSIDQIRAKMAAIIADNTKLYSYLLYKWQLRASFSGTRGSAFPRFGGSPGGGEEVRMDLPAFNGHFQIVDKRPVSVMDGWADRPPLPERDLKKRVLTAKQGEPETLDLMQALLTPSHSVALVGIASQNGGRAYMFESVPNSRMLAPAGSAIACASALKATVFVDTATSFPIRMDAEVVNPKMCSASGTYPLDAVGTREQIHYIKTARKNPCGDVVEIWVMDEAVQTDTNMSDGYIAFPGSIAERTWPLGARYRGTTFKSTTIRSDFQIFMTCAVINFGDPVESKPIESVRSEIRFDLDNPALPFHEARGVK
jgi:hypothetical protein